MIRRAGAANTFPRGSVSSTTHTWRRGGAVHRGSPSVHRSGLEYVKTTQRRHAMDSAVLVVDMQNGFVHPRGSLARIGFELVDLEAVVESNVALLAEARRL